MIDALLPLPCMPPVTPCPVALISVVEHRVDAVVGGELCKVFPLLAAVFFPFEFRRTLARPFQEQRPACFISQLVVQGCCCFFPASVVAISRVSLERELYLFYRRIFFWWRLAVVLYEDAYAFASILPDFSIEEIKADDLE